MENITAPRFTNEDAARTHLESLQWPDGPFCPHCGSLKATRLPAQRGRPTTAHPEGAIRNGIIQCNDCRKQYSVTVGTVFESSKVPLHKWLMANHLLCSSKKGMSAHQLHRMLGVTYKTAWFMTMRIREAMRPTETPPMGGTGGRVEADETYIGRVKGIDAPRGGFRHKMRVVSLVDRDTGVARSFVSDSKSVGEVANIVRANVDRETKLTTDEARHYWTVGKEFAAHDRVLHAGGEYVRGDVHTNTIEGFFSIFKRGMKGVYQHCGEQHLHRYLAEFDFRYTNRSANGVEDAERADMALAGIAGKRVTYRRTDFAYA